MFEIGTKDWDPPRYELALCIATLSISANDWSDCGPCKPWGERVKSLNYC